MRTNSGNQSRILKIFTVPWKPKQNHVFLDVISPEYDALNLQRNSIRALIKTNGKDPLFVHQRKKSRDFYLLNQDPREGQVLVEDIEWSHVEVIYLKCI